MSTEKDIVKRLIAPILRDYYNSCLTWNTSGMPEHKVQNSLSDELNKAVDKILRLNKRENNCYLFCYTYDTREDRKSELEHKADQLLIFAPHLEAAYHEFAVKISEKVSGNVWNPNIHAVIIERNR